MLRYSYLALDNLCNLLCRHYKKVLNWEDLSVKLRYSLEKEIFIENKNILLISCGILYGSQGEGFSNPNIAYDRHENTHQNTQQFSNNPLYKIVRINGVDYLYNLFDDIIEIHWDEWNPI